MIRTICLCLSCMLGSSPAYGYMMAVNQRLDHALHSKSDPKLVVAGHITAVVVPKPTTMYYDRPIDPKDSVTFAVRSVILGSEAWTNVTIEVPVSAFRWPTELVPCRDGRFCILVIDKHTFAWDYQTWLTSVVPARDHDYPHVTDNLAAQRVLASELLAEIKGETDVTRLRAMLMQVSPVLSREQAGELVGFLRHPDTWVRRAALGGLLYATADEKYLKMTEQDLREFIRTTKPNDVIDGPHKGIRSSAYWMLVACYPFLEVGWGPEEAQRYPAFLPLYRLIAQKMPQQGYRRFDYGIKPLCRFGTISDARILYEYLDREQTGKQQGATGNQFMRRTVLDGLSRILSLPPHPSTIPSDEDIQMRQIRSALVSRGIIEESALQAVSEPSMDR